MELRELWDRLCSVLYPQRCVLCGAVVEYDDLWCGCAFPAEDMLLEGEEGDSWDAVCSPLAYVDNLRQPIWSLKKQPDLRAVKFLTEHMANTVLRQWNGEFDLLVPVPINPAKEKERGFNQALLLAEGLSPRLGGLPTAPHALARRDDTQVQHTLSREERADNALRSYTLGAPMALTGQRVLLVDDVYTTGATLSACAALLRQGGAAAVYCVTATHSIDYQGFHGDLPKTNMP